LYFAGTVLPFISSLSSLYSSTFLLEDNEHILFGGAGNYLIMAVELLFNCREDFGL
jgi:hypothetical protein